MTKESNRGDICLQTLLLLFKYASHKNKRSFVSTANEALVGTLMTIGDVNDFFPIKIHEYRLKICSDLKGSSSWYFGRIYSFLNFEYNKLILSSEIMKGPSSKHTELNFLGNDGPLFTNIT